MFKSFFNKEDAERKKLLKRYNFSTREKVEMGSDLAQLNNKKQQLEMEKKRVMKQYASEISTVETEMNEVTDQINSGFKMVEIDSYLIRDFNTLKRRWYNWETNELLAEENFTKQDHQLKLEDQKREEEAQKAKAIADEVSREIKGVDEEGVTVKPALTKAEIYELLARNAELPLADFQEAVVSVCDGSDIDALHPFGFHVVKSDSGRTLKVFFADRSAETRNTISGLFDAILSIFDVTNDESLADVGKPETEPSGENTDDGTTSYEIPATDETAESTGPEMLDFPDDVKIPHVWGRDDDGKFIPPTPEQMEGYLADPGRSDEYKDALKRYVESNGEDAADYVRLVHAEMNEPKTAESIENGGAIPVEVFGTYPPAEVATENAQAEDKEDLAEFAELIGNTADLIASKTMTQKADVVNGLTDAINGDYERMKEFGIKIFSHTRKQVRIVHKDKTVYANRDVNSLLSKICGFFQ